MGEINWDSYGNRLFSLGLDQGVLYLGPNRVGVAWNGLISVEEKSTTKEERLYFDGVVQHILLKPEAYKGTIQAFTFPDEFIEYQSEVQVVTQKDTTFSLSYRVFVGNDTQGPEAYYQIHILYNLTALTGTLKYQTDANTPSVLVFSWEVESVPEEIEGFIPTSHVILDSRFLSTNVKTYLETILYKGGYSTSKVSPAEILPVSDTTSNVFPAEIIESPSGMSVVDPYVDEGSGPVLPPLKDLLNIVLYFKAFRIEPNAVNGFYSLQEEYCDLTATATDGLYVLLPDTTLQADDKDGFYTLQDVV